MHDTQSHPIILGKDEPRHVIISGGVNHTKFREFEVGVPHQVGGPPALQLFGWAAVMFLAGRGWRAMWSGPDIVLHHVSQPVV